MRMTWHMALMLTRLAFSAINELRSQNHCMTQDIEVFYSALIFHLCW
ncbi:hypothetical protein ACB098_01G209600 [Castanea mollissima]